MKKKYNYFIAAGILLLIVFLIIISIKSCRELKEGEDRISRIEKGLSEGGIDYSDQIDKSELEKEIFSDESEDDNNDVNKKDKSSENVISDDSNSLDKDTPEREPETIKKPVKKIVKPKPIISAPTNKSSGESYIVIVGSFKSEENADLMIQITKKWGYKNPRKKRMPSGFIAVYVKEFKTKREADVLAKAITKNRNLETYVTTK